MSIWQTKKWQEMLKKSGQVSEFFEVDKLFIEKRKVSMWEYWLFILWLKEPLSPLIRGNLIDLCKKENCLFFQVETVDYSDSIFLLFPKGVPEGGGIIPGYYKKFITPYTAIIDLEKTEEEILAKMKPKGRYNIKLATKKGVIAEIVEKNETNIKSYYDLMLETTSRDNFSGNSLEYYSDFLNNLENSKLILAKKDDKVIAWGIFVFDTEVSIYYYWASSSDKEYRNLMAPYLVQWEAIKHAKSIESKIYDFLWVATPWDENSELAWVTSFKKKLTSDIIKVSDSYIYINKTIKYFVINTLRKLIRWIILKK